MQTFIKNNLSFRVVSSNAIAKFKAGQAFDFNELARKNNSFSASSKETLLLEYEYWFKWVLRVEKIFLMLGEEESPKVLVDQLCNSVKLEFGEIEDMMRCHPEVFEQVTVDFISVLHKSLSDALCALIRLELAEADMFSAFSLVSNNISDYLQLVLFSLYELEAISNKEPAFIDVSTFCHNTKCDTGICILTEKAKYFRDTFDVDKFIIKNYTSHDITDECMTIFAENDLSIERIDFVKENK